MWDKLQHEMYWNAVVYFLEIFAERDKLQHEMYWNSATLNYVNTRFSINYNMRCIETGYAAAGRNGRKSINYNMRCIETSRACFATQITTW